jgi:D-methionine transport system ATP-binding protein
MTLTDPLIRLDQVAKSFPLPDGRRLHAVRPLSLEVALGDVFGLVGESGAGKSTLLRLMNLLERPDQGRVFVDGRELTALPAHALRAARRQIGVVFRDFNLLSNASVFENVAVPLRVDGRLTRHQVDARVRGCLARLGLAGQAGRHPAQLSGAQKQRVAIARALACEPAVLLCDEPASTPDPESTGDLLDALRNINAESGVTIVIATHDLQVASALCRQVAVVEHGWIAERFDVGDATEPGEPVPATRLGRELVRLQADAPRIRELDLLVPAMTARPRSAAVPA